MNEEESYKTMLITNNDAAFSFSDFVLPFVSVEMAVKWCFRSHLFGVFLLLLRNVIENNMNKLIYFLIIKTAQRISKWSTP